MPIVLMTRINYAAEHYLGTARSEEQNAVVLDTYERMKAGGDEAVYLFESRDVIGLCSDHPSADGPPPDGPGLPDVGRGGGADCGRGDGAGGAAETHVTGDWGWRCDPPRFACRAEFSQSVNFLPIVRLKTVARPRARPKDCWANPRGFIIMRPVGGACKNWKTGAVRDGPLPGWRRRDGLFRNEGVTGGFPARWPA